jgi:Xaa-Pro aminopeptidase
MPPLELPPLIGPDEIKARQHQAAQLAAGAGFDALLIVGRSFYDRPGDLAYLSGHFPPFPSAVFSGANRGMGHGFLLLPASGEPTLLTDPRKHRADLVAVDDVRAASDLGSATVALLRERSLASGRIGLVGEDILPAAFDRQFDRDLPQMRLEPAESLVAGMRRIKSPEEQELLRAAGRCADAGLMSAVEAIQQPGATERTVCAAGIAACMNAGADFVRYFRVHSGPWSATGSRWPQAMDREIEPGDVVVLDAIGALGGYAFDVNRTTVKGRPTEDILAALDLADAATSAAVAACRPGSTASDVADAAHAIFEPSEWNTYVSTTMGHGIGLETVEDPYISRGDQSLLEPGMVVCIEPGIFVPGRFGAVIEQEVIVQPHGPEIITPTPARLW